MPIVTLLRPGRVNTRGHIFERNVAKVVSAAVARALADDPRFRVEGLTEAQVNEPEAETAVAETVSTNPAVKTKPTDTAALYQAIRDAADKLDVNNDENFTAAGKPQVTALEKILGYDITASERDAALAEVLPKGKTEKVEDKPKGGVRIITKSQAAQKEADKDPTTTGAVEV